MGGEIPTVLVPKRGGLIRAALKKSRYVVRNITNNKKKLKLTLSVLQIQFYTIVSVSYTSITLQFKECNFSKSVGNRSRGYLQSFVIEKLGNLTVILSQNRLNFYMFVQWQVAGGDVF